jgi:thiol-disulfide isomerase/thioredoxin
MNSYFKIPVCMMVWLLYSTAIVAQVKIFKEPGVATIRGERTTIAAQATTRLRAIIFLSPECPLCRNYTRTLNQLQKKYATDMTIIGVFPGESYTEKDYQEYQQKYSIVFPLLTDKKSRLASALKATVTPEVFLLDANGTLKYSGAIDDWIVRLGKSRKTAEVHYLEDAIKNTLTGTGINPAYVRPVGCRINDY